MKKRTATEILELLVNDGFDAITILKEKTNMVDGIDNVYEEYEKLIRGIFQECGHEIDAFLLKYYQNDPSTASQNEKDLPKERYKNISTLRSSFMEGIKKGLKESMDDNTCDEIVMIINNAFLKVQGRILNLRRRRAYIQCIIMILYKDNISDNHNEIKDLMQLIESADHECLNDIEERYIKNTNIRSNNICLPESKHCTENSPILDLVRNNTTWLEAELDRIQEEERLEKKYKNILSDQEISLLSRKIVYEKTKLLEYLENEALYENIAGNKCSDDTFSKNLDCLKAPNTDPLPNPW